MKKSKKDKIELNDNKKEKINHFENYYKVV